MEPLIKFDVRINRRAFVNFGRSKFELSSARVEWRKYIPYTKPKIVLFSAMTEAIILPTERKLEF